MGIPPSLIVLFKHEIFLLKHFDMSSVTKALVTWKFPQWIREYKQEGHEFKKTKQKNPNKWYIHFMDAE